MRLRIRVKPGAREEKVSREPDGSLLVSVTARAQEGKANEAVVKAVASFLRIPKSQVRIRSGLASRAKLLEVPDPPGPTLPNIG
ncbi:DUF167 domain-containing protein [candidate division WOR-3 bacterium]|uniref:UPF0235 protein FJY68_08845 n=1 Tax=candidate division WOR-3 bacterium TaxID=2052148 RepID=A0A937XGE3_UNCW3|nr:DUF167 domain-containing protein [candidate division WOR-3 bacterium]